MDKLILNFLPIATGGGLQNALSLLSELMNSSVDFEVEVIVREAGLLAKALHDVPYVVHEVPSGFLARLKFELGVRSLFDPGTLCFTLFGPPLIGGVGYLVNVNGCAYSNLFYPELEFWKDYRGLSRVKRELVDVYRRKLTACADAWIFETSVLSRRAVELCNFPKERVHTVQMAASALVAKDKVNGPILEKYKSLIGDRFAILFLNGANRNKRVQNLPSIAKFLVALGRKDIVFVTTLPDNSELCLEVERELIQTGVEDFFVNVGPIAQNEVSTLIEACDAMATFSRLESFSNNFVEAWRMGKLLFATDADWSRAACGDSAIYIDPDKEELTAEVLSRVVSDSALRGDVVFNSVKQLNSYPTVREKNERYIEVIKSVADQGICKFGVKRLIKWPRASYKPLAK